VKKYKIIQTVQRLLIQKQSLWSLGGNGVSALAGLMLFAISSSRLSASDFGIWVLFQTVSTLFDMFRTGLLLPGYLQLSAGLSRKGKSSIYNSVQIIFLLMTLGQSLLCWTLQLIVPIDSAWHFFFANYPLILISGALLTLAEWWFQSNLRFQHILLLRSIHRLLLISLAFFLVFDLTRLIYAQVATNVFCGAIIYILFKMPRPKKLVISPSHRSKLFHFGKYATPSQLLSNLLRSSDTLMISSAMGVAATGIYGAASKFLEFIELPLRSFGAVNFNHLAKMANAGKHHESFSYAMQRIRSTTIKIVPIAILLWIFSPQLISFLSGPHYAASVPVLRIMAVYCVLIPADRYFGLLLEAFGRPDLNLVKVFAMLCANVVGDIIAISLFNTPVAIAVSSIITFSIGVGFGLWLVTTKAMPRLPEINLKVAMSRH